MRAYANRMTIALLLMLGTLAPWAAAADTQPDTTAPPYLQSVSSKVSNIVPILTVGEGVGDYRMVGIPDGMGVINASDASFTLLMNHEFYQHHGIKRAHGGKGAFVSQWSIGFTPRSNGYTFHVKDGEDHIRRVYDWNDRTGMYGRIKDGELARFCSAFLSGPEHGFDQPVFFAGEEMSDARTLDGVKGGQSFAIINREAWALPRLGRYPKENQIVLPHTGESTVVVGLDDANEAYVWVYVGTKQPEAASPLDRAGLTNGRLYVLRTDDAKHEGQLRKGKPVRFTLHEVDWRLDVEELKARARSLGATLFQRIEDGTHDRKNPHIFYFDTTGIADQDMNPNGKLHRLTFDEQADPTKGGTIDVMLDGSEGVISLDNLDINNAGDMLIQEDPIIELSGRDSSIWLFNVHTHTLTRVLEVDTDVARKLHGDAYTPGSWETSGVIDMEHILGKGWWLVNVQAHYAIDDPELVEGGQLLAIRISGSSQ